MDQYQAAQLARYRMEMTERSAGEAAAHAERRRAAAQARQAGSPWFRQTARAGRTKYETHGERVVAPAR
jgi:hypothetical protein